MGEPGLEDLFLRFRDKGDANALAAVFDRTACELLTLALHLAPESSAAEDLVQATFLAAIQAADSFERGRRVMPWLVGILANQAARARRDRARVIDPLRVETRPEPDPAHTTEQSEVLATLTRAIDDLPDTCRESVRRHLLEGERAVDIARADGTAPGTVRMQILRGLDRLRRTLPASLLSVAPITIEAARMTTIRAAVLSAARSHIAIATTSAGAGVVSAPLLGLTPAIGGAFVALKLCIAAIVLALAGLVAWRVSERPQSATLAVLTPPASSHADIDAPGSAASPERAIAPTNADRVESPSSPAATITQAGWWVTGDVHVTAGIDVTQTTVRVSCLTGTSKKCQPNAAGHFELDISEYFSEGKVPDYVLVYAFHPAHADADTGIPVDAEKVQAGSSRRVEWNVDLHLEPFAVLAGRVDVPEGDLPQWIPVVLFHNDRTPSNPKWTKVSSADRRPDGTFEMRVDGSGDALMVAKAEGLVPVCTPVHFERGTRSDVGTLQLVRGELSIEGRLALSFVADGERRGFTASVRARRPGAEPTADQDWHGVHLSVDSLRAPRVELNGQKALVDANGSFRFHGLPPGAWDLDLDLDGVVQLGPRSTTCVIPGPSIVLGAELDRWNIHVVSKGKPVPGAALVATFAGQDMRFLADDQGSARVVAPFSTGFELAVSAPGFAANHAVIPPAAQAVDGALDIELALADDPRATLIVSLTDPKSAPDFAQVTLHPVDWDAEPIDKLFRVGAGPYEIDEIPPGKWSVLVQPAAKAWFGMPGGSDVQDVHFEVLLARHERHVETITFEKGGRVEFEIEGWNEVRTESEPWAHIHVRDALRQPITVALVVREAHSGIMTLAAYEDQIALYAASTLRSSLPPGAYTLEIDDPDWTGRAVEFRVKVGETTKVRVAVARR